MARDNPRAAQIGAAALRGGLAGGAKGALKDAAMTGAGQALGKMARNNPRAAQIGAAALQEIIERTRHNPIGAGFAPVRARDDSLEKAGASYLASRGENAPKVVQAKVDVFPLDVQGARSAVASAGVAQLKP
jgi:hypothetical protein